MTEPTYGNSVFINCPFDARYAKLFRAIVFTVQDCGFVARCALEAEDGGEERLRKIKRIIRECRYGIHDISRVQLDRGTQLPRFNMPLELGLFLGAQEYGVDEQRSKRSLILDTVPYRYQKFCSDISGQDIRAHRNQPPRVIASARAMLATALGGSERVPGPDRIHERYETFRSELAGTCHDMNVRTEDLQFVEMRSLMQVWIDEHPLRR